MKKGYYIHFSARDNIGVSKKIDMQLNVFRNFFHMEEINVPFRKVSAAKIIWNHLPFASIDRWEYENSLLKIEQPDFIYIRRMSADRRYLRFITALKHKYPNCKILLEVYTYPYDRDEYHSLHSFPYGIKDRYYRKYYKKYIDRIVTFSPSEIIFGVKTIRISNGTVMNQCSLYEHPETSVTLQLITVANYQKHHGCERLLKGLAEYKKANCSPAIIYHMVGEGKELIKYRRLVEKLNLQDTVIFHGSKTGAELEALYRQADIAVTSLGLYKLGINYISTLKEPEYASHGLPIVGACTTPLSGYDWYLNLPNNPETISVPDIISWHQNLKAQTDSTAKFFATQIWEDAASQTDINKTMQPVIKYINEN